MTNTYHPSTWAHYNKKMVHTIEHPQFVGSFTPSDTEGRNLRLASSYQTRGPDKLRLYLLVDEMDGVIADIRYQVMGPTPLICGLEAACQLLLRKNYDQARRMSADLIDREVRDKEGHEAFPLECYGYLNMILDAILEAAQQCMDIPIDETELSSPLPPDLLSGSGIDNWEALPHTEKLAILEHVIEQEIRPYIELDAGGIRIIHLTDAHHLTIAYEGSCTSCHSATGSTLSAIQQILRSKVSPSIVVIPDLSLLS